MIKDKDVKIAVDKEEKLLLDTIEMTESRIRELKLTLKIQLEMLEFLKREARSGQKLPINPKINSAVA